jgi:hypothetical protein
MKLRRQAFTAVVAALLGLGGALGAASTAEAAGGTTNYGPIYGPWSCGPDQQAGISYRASGPISVDALVSYPTGPVLTGTYSPSGTGVVWAWGRTVYWFEASVSNGGKLISYARACR